MKHFLPDLKQIYQTERIMLFLMVLNLLGATILLIFSIVHLNPSSPMVKIGYGDIGGYRDGPWTEILVFPLFALILGVVHTFIALKVYHKRGAGMTKFFLLTTTMLIFGAFIVLIRLIRES